MVMVTGLFGGQTKRIEQAANKRKTIFFVYSIGMDKARIRSTGGGMVKGIQSRDRERVLHWHGEPLLFRVTKNLICVIAFCPSVVYAKKASK